MPTLPGKELSQEHFDRVVNAFPGSTMAEKAASYDAWLTNNLIEYVLQRESAAVDAALRAERAIRISAIQDGLPARPPMPTHAPTPPPVVPAQRGQA